MSARWGPVIRSASYDTPDNPKLIETPNHNDAKPTVARSFTPAPFIDSDTRPLAARLLDQQWRDAGRERLFEHVPLSINPSPPSNQTVGGAVGGGGGGSSTEPVISAPNGQGLFTMTGQSPQFVNDGGGLFTVTSANLHADGAGLFTYTNSS